MGIASQGARLAPLARAQWLRQLLCWPGFAALLIALAPMLLPLQAQAAAAPQRWSLTDSSGQLWGLYLVEQPDPAYPAGWRLRLTGRSLGQPLITGGRCCSAMASAAPGPCRTAVRNWCDWERS
jgi:hypothetical protein